MPRRCGRRVSLAVLVGGLVLVLATGRATATTAQGTGSRDTPVLFVHGYNFIPLCPMSDVEFSFGVARATLADRGRTGPMPAVGYYACDQNVEREDWLDAHGPDGHAGAFGGRGHLPHLTEERLSHDADADIRHLAYHLAWLIWDRWSSDGQPVHLVGSSMGGLVVRWMMYRVDAGDPAFPPALHVGAAVMVAAPFAGVRDAVQEACATLSFDALQCEQMRAGSAFLRELAGWRGTGGAAWTTIASACDELIAPRSARAIAPARHYLYTLPCYMHSGPLGILNGAATNGPILLSERGPDAEAWRGARGRVALALLHELLP